MPMALFGYMFTSHREDVLLTSWANWQSPSRGDRANCDVMDESYVLEGYPHGCGVRLHSMVEYLTSLEDRCLLSTSISRSYGFR